MNNINVIMVKIGPLFQQAWSSLFFWRALSFSLLGLLFLAFLFKDIFREMLLQSSRNKHDKELFHLLDLQMPERRLLDLLEKLKKDKAYEVNSLQFIDKFRASLKEQTRQYLNSKLKKTSINCMETLDKLRDFMNDNFILFPDTTESSSVGQTMYPNPEIDGGGDDKQKDSEKFAIFVAAMNTNITAVKKNYSKYRALIKEIIQI